MLGKFRPRRRGKSRSQSRQGGDGGEVLRKGLVGRPLSLPLLSPRRNGGLVFVNPSGREGGLGGLLGKMHPRVLPGE